MAQDANIKSKINAVIAAVPNADRDHVALALEYFNNDIKRTVDAFIKDGAHEALSQWQSTSGKVEGGKKKKKKKKAATATSDEAISSSQQSNVGTGQAIQPQQKQQQPSAKTQQQQQIPNGFVGDLRAVKATTTHSQPANAHQANEEYKLHTKKELRVRTQSEASTASSVDWPASSRNPRAGIEKSCKDLQRQMISLQHNRVVMNEQIDKGFKRITELFKELHSLLNEREAELVLEMDKVKNEANDLLASHQSTAVLLKLQTDRAPSMNDADVAQLRTKIKLFVSDKKALEDVCSSQRFFDNFAHLMEEIKTFGEVKRVATATRRLSNITPAVADKPVVVDNKQSAVSTPVAAKQTNSNAASTKPVGTGVAKTLLSEQLTNPPAAVVTESHVMTQSASLTQYELRLAAEKRDNLVTSTTTTPSVGNTGRGRGDTSRGRGLRGTGTGRINDSKSQSDQPRTPATSNQENPSNRGRGQGRGRGTGRGRGRGQTGTGPS